jgi:hypothetical protein
MKNAEKIKNALRPGRVCRRQELGGLTTAVDRDLKTLVRSGEVRKLGYGLYYRPKKNPFGDAPPEDRELVRAFLKTDDFLIASCNNFVDLGLESTQVRGRRLVYNHKRSGDITVGGRRFSFRLVPAYPKKPSKEYLLVDLLNRLAGSSDDAGRALANLPSRLSEFDRDKLSENLERFGRPAARRILRRVERERRASLPLKIVDEEDDRADLRFWLERSPAERVGAVELLREQHYALAGYKTLPRLIHAVGVMDRPG